MSLKLRDYRLAIGLLAYPRSFTPGGLRRTMPMNGEINDRFGVYRSVCCGAEIVISDGVTFPDCPRHEHLSTVWRLVNDEKIPHASELMKNKKRNGNAA
jgi:hypothetical protein